MTRLTEALERAQANGGGSAVAAVAPQAVHDVPADWQFDEADAPKAVRDVPPAWKFDEIDGGFDSLPSQEIAPVQAAAAAAPAPAQAAADTRLNVMAGQDALKTSARTSASRTEKLVLGGQHDNLLIEQFRRLAAVLHHAQQQRQARTVMIASAVPSEGKSLTASNLALTLSRSFEKRVLLIDTDLRRPTLHTLFNVPNTAGLTTSLNDPLQGQMPIVQVQENLWLLPAGRPDPNPTSLVTSPAMKQLLTEAATQFDWVILDTPPVGLMPDANLLAAMMDAAFLVVQAGRTPYPLVQKAVAAIGLERVLGVVLNQAERSAAEGAYSYGYYAYYSDESRTPPNRKRFSLG